MKNTEKLFQLGFLVLLAVLLAGVAVLLLRQASPGGIRVVLPTATSIPVLSVYVTGPVQLPDVYELPLGALVQDALEAAGGATDQADLTRLNLARRLNDGEHLVVPELGEAALAPSLDRTRVNINTAALEELDTLYGIGPALAQAIVDYREAHGDFQRPEDLMQVSGIGPSTFQELQDSITVY